MSKNKLTIDEFTAEIVEGVLKKVPKELRNKLEIQTMTVNKPNGNSLRGITFRRDDDDLAPTFYLEEPYKDYLDGEDVEYIVTELAKSYMISLVSPRNLIPEDPNMETIKDNLALRVINLEKNASYLENIPYYPVGFGLALICDIKMDDGMGGCWRTHVIKDFIEGESEDTLFNVAFANVKNVDPPMLRTSAIEDPDSPDVNLLDIKGCIKDSDKEPMYAVTTEGGYYGASAFFYPGIQEKVAKKLGESYYALPSSVHEFVIIPSSADPAVSFLEEILRATNKAPGCEEYMISDDVFYYDINTRTLSLASDNALS